MSTFGGGSSYWRPMILLLDGYNLVFRSYYGMPTLNRSDGFPTNAIHGWIRTLWHLQDREETEAMIAFFDLGPSVREVAFADYKQNRGEMPDDLRQQVPVIKELTALMGIPIVEAQGVEADDLIASYAARYASADNPVAIVSADKDLAQCLNPWVCQWLPPPTANPKLGWRILEASGVVDKFGVGPDQIADYLALVGDTADNIPGVPGVGPKTAVKWLQDYGDVEGVIRKANYLTPPRFQVLVGRHVEQLRLNRQLTVLRDDYEVAVDLEKGPDVPGLLTKLESLEMRKACADARQRYG